MFISFSHIIPHFCDGHSCLLGTPDALSSSKLLIPEILQYCNSLWLHAANAKHSHNTDTQWLTAKIWACVITAANCSHWHWTQATAFPVPECCKISICVETHKKPYKNNLRIMEILQIEIWNITLEMNEEQHVTEFLHWSGMHLDTA